MFFKFNFVISSQTSFVIYIYQYFIRKRQTWKCSTILRFCGLGKVIFMIKDEVSFYLPF